MVKKLTCKKKKKKFRLNSKLRLRAAREGQPFLYVLFLKKLRHYIFDNAFFVLSFCDPNDVNAFV